MNTTARYPKDESKLVQALNTLPWARHEDGTISARFFNRPNPDALGQHIALQLEICPITVGVSAREYKVVFQERDLRKLVALGLNNFPGSEQYQTPVGPMIDVISPASHKSNSLRARLQDLKNWAHSKVERATRIPEIR